MMTAHDLQHPLVLVRDQAPHVRRALGGHAEAAGVVVGQLIGSAAVGVFVLAVMRLVALGMGF